MVNITVKIQDGELRAVLTQLKARTEDLTPVMRIIGQTVKSSVIQNFIQGGRPRWQPTKHISKQIAYSMGSRAIAGDEDIKGLKYRKGKKTHKAYKGGEIETKGFARYSAGKKTLVDTARLQNSITAKAFANRAEIGTNVIYGAIHQFGGKAGRGRKVNIPARPFLAVQNEDWASITSAINDYLTKGLK